MAKEHAIEDLSLAISLLIRRIRANAPAEFREFSWTQKSVLKRLEAGPATAADLARAEGVKPQSMGAVIASLEELNLVERKPHPTDGRQMNIKLTAKGAQLRKSSQEAKYVWLSKAIDRLDKQEQATLFKAGQLIRRMVEDNQ